MPSSGQPQSDTDSGCNAEVVLKNRNEAGDSQQVVEQNWLRRKVNLSGIDSFDRTGGMTDTTDTTKDRLRAAFMAMASFSSGMLATIGVYEAIQAMRKR